LQKRRFMRCEVRRVVELDDLQNDYTMNASLPSFRLIEILIGFVCGLIGLGLFVLFAMLLFESVDRWTMPKTAGLMEIMAIPPLGIFFSILSYRLFTVRGAKDGGGLLSPSGWRIIGISFAFLAGIFFIGMIGLNMWELTGSLVATIVFTAMCFYVANRHRNKT
jgi:hypothetical protein